MRLRAGRHEVDLIVERPDGAVVTVEPLHWLVDKLGDRLLDAVVVSTGPAAYRGRTARLSYQRHC